MAIYDFLIQAPESEHVVHFFDNEKDMLQTVANFISLGITQRDGILLITSRPRLDALQVFQGFKVSDQIIVLNTSEMLSRFFINGKLNEQGYKEKITEAVESLRTRFKKVRVWGGMVNAFLEDGLKDAAIECEKT